MKNGGKHMWIVFAALSAVFASLTSILAKVGVEDVNSNLATAIRTVTVVVMAWVIVIATGQVSGIGQISAKTWIFLGLSGIATGLSWLCYYRALQMADVSKVVPVDKLSIVITMFLAFLVLGEKATPKTIAGAALITAGTFVMIL
jgi:Predicted membrane protein